MTTATHNDDHVPADLEEAVQQPGPSLVPRQGAAASRSLWASFFDESALAIRQMWHAYWRWRARQTVLMFLHSIDERTLKDFGVTREEIHSFLDKQFTLGTLTSEHEAGGHAECRITVPLGSP